MKNPTKSLTKNLIFSILLFLAFAAVLSSYSLDETKPAEIQMSDVVARISEEKVKSIVVKGDLLDLELVDGTKEVSRKETGESFSTQLANYGADPAKVAKVAIDVRTESGWAYWIGTLVPFLLPFILISFFIYFMMRQVQGANTRAMSFGQSGAREQAKNDKNRVTFKDVAGVKEAKEELLEVVEFLRNPKKFIALGAKIPKGVLLMGSPGTGKTLLARAVAGEANVPFFHISGSEFVEMFVGVGASRVRDLFNKAKKQAPCIIFVDEIDAVGRQRGAGLGGSHDEREQTLNQILVEMDGFDPNQGVIVLAATNRPDVLDPALLRPGRFDRRVVLDPPDLNDREAILGIHAKNKPLEEGVNLHLLSQRTPGFSGADLGNLMNEAAILAARRNKKRIGMDELLESIEKVMLGPERKSYILDEYERKVTAYHEAGHAIVAHMLPDADDVHKVSIISRGTAAGYTMKLPNEDKRMHRKAEFLADLAVSLGGYVAETEIYGKDNLTTGASSDLRHATRLARKLITDYGMSEKLGPRTYGEKEEMVFLGRDFNHQRDYSEKVAEMIDQEITSMLHDAMATAKKVFTENRDKVEKIVATLIEKETIEKDLFEEILGKPVHPEKAQPSKA
jgi:cell division protease FtsH